MTPSNWRDNRLPLSFLVRTRGSPAALLASAREAVADVLPELPIARLGTMESELAEAMSGSWTLVRLLGSLSLLAMLPTAVGLYGVVSNAVGRRRREFGVRLALGEDRSLLLASVLGSCWRVTAGGIAIGAMGAYALSRLLANHFESRPADAVGNFLLMAAVLLAVATAAGFLPATRASRVDPNAVLRES